MKHIAFALDPDGYWVEIIGQRPVEETEAITETDPATYLFNHTMIRVKDKDASLKFYQDIMGMSLVRTVENETAGFNLYFLGYDHHHHHGGDSGNKETPSPPHHREGLLELTWNYGTEKDPNFKYHSGNEEPQGFGHIAVSVDDLEKACERFEILG